MYDHMLIFNTVTNVHNQAAFKNMSKTSYQPTYGIVDEIRDSNMELGYQNEYVIDEWWVVRNLG